MSMQTPEMSFGHETEAVSLEAPTPSTSMRYEEAHRLACAIEELLAPATPDAAEKESYGPRLARALARSLIDQLADLNRAKKSA